MKKFLISLDFMVVLVILFGMFLLLPTTNYQLTVHAQTAATLSLSPSIGSFNRGCPYSVSINLDTAGAQTDGTDAYLRYDPTRLTPSSLVSGSIYADYPGNNIDSAGGKITILGLADVTSPFTGKGVLATVNFIVKSDAPTGVTQVVFDFDPNDKTKTTDSNVIQRGTVTDILNSVVNGSYTIGTGACPLSVGSGVIATPSATVAPTSPPTLPPAGSAQFTYTVAIIGSILVVLGILGLAIL